jgi:hypothetical protein
MSENIIAVFPDGTFKVYISKELALASKPLFISFAKVHSDFPTVKDPERKKYIFEILDQQGKPYKINCNGWNILKVIKYYFYQPHTELEISSPEGEIRNIDTHDSVNLESIGNLQKFINEFRDYKDWSYYDLKQTNLLLQREIDSLKIEIADLRDDANS